MGGGLNRIVQGDNLEVLRGMATGSVALVYIDPPFNTGRRQTRLRMKTVRDEAGDRVGFGGHRYRTELIKAADGSTEVGDVAGYADRFDDFPGFLRPRLLEAYRVLAPTGSLFFHIDFREVHYCKVMLDEIFGRDCFQNEIVWAYDYGARATKRWPAKHDNILWYTRDPQRYTFNLGESDRIPYMALARPRAARRPPTSGGTPSSRPPARKRPATPRRSRLESWSGSCACTPTPATWCSTSSPAAGPRARQQPRTAAPSAWWTRTRKPSS
jgi:site-specific DNA-methyltransferase (adenine-specific)